MTAIKQEKPEKTTWEKVHIPTDSIDRCRNCGYPLAGTIARVSTKGQKKCGRCYWMMPSATSAER